MAVIPSFSQYYHSKDNRSVVKQKVYHFLKKIVKNHGFSSSEKNPQSPVTTNENCRSDFMHFGLTSLQ